MKKSHQGETRTNALVRNDSYWRVPLAKFWLIGTQAESLLRPVVCTVAVTARLLYSTAPWSWIRMRSCSHKRVTFSIESPQPTADPSSHYQQPGQSVLCRCTPPAQSHPIWSPYILCFTRLVSHKQTAHAANSHPSFEIPVLRLVSPTLEFPAVEVAPNVPSSSAFEQARIGPNCVLHPRKMRRTDHRLPKKFRC